MRTLAGDYATIYYPDEFIYSEDVCNIFCKQTAGTVTGYVLIITYSSVSPSGYSKSVNVRLTPDAEGNAFVDIAPYNRAMVTECAGTLARLTLNITVHVASAESLNLQTMTLEPGTGRLLYTSTTAGEAVQPPKQVMCAGLGDYVKLLFDLQSTLGNGKLQRNAAGVWTDVLTLTEPTGVDTQIKTLVTADLTETFPTQYRVLNYTGAVVWQGVIDNVGEACSVDKWAKVEWRSDQWLNKKSWVFKIKSISRKVTGSQDIAVQPFVYEVADYYNTQGVNERNGQGFNRQKNWQIQMQVVVDGLTEREMMYFNDLFTSPEVMVKAEALGRYGNNYLSKVQAAVDGNSITTTFKVERGSLTFTLLIAEFKQY
ncbi:MAG: hypothetical protein IIT93_03700 [Paludibacteraceae bacterium]|nr:hypothetical protein [Paludibacteraceae bacterium]